MATPVSRDNFGGQWWEPWTNSKTKSKPKVYPERGIMSRFCSEGFGIQREYACRLQDFVRYSESSSPRCFYEVSKWSRRTPSFTAEFLFRLKSIKREPKIYQQCGKIARRPRCIFWGSVCTQNCDVEYLFAGSGGNWHFGYKPSLLHWIVQRDLFSSLFIRRFAGKIKVLIIGNAFTRDLVGTLAHWRHAFKRVKVHPTTCLLHL